MKPILPILFFLVNFTYGFSQKDADPFALKPHSIEENNIKAITQYDDDDIEVQRAIYDQHGNQVYHKQDGRVTEFELDYDQDGHLKEEIAVGFRYELILKKRSTYNNAGQIDSIYYVLPIPMYYEGFIEKYNYNKESRIANLEVYSVPDNRLMFQHKYVYGDKNKLETIQTFQIAEEMEMEEEKEDSILFFTTEFKYYKNGDLMSSSQLSAKRDTIAISLFDEEGLLVHEIVSDFYTTPHHYLYSASVYLEALKELNTPLTSFSIIRNLSSNKRGPIYLTHVKHQYEKGRLLKSIRTVKNKSEEFIMSTDNYSYNAQNELIERRTFNFFGQDQDTTIVKFKAGSTQRYIDLDQKTRSYLVIKGETASENFLGELIIEGFYQKWECKTTTEFDSTANTVTKKRFCVDPDGVYPVEPEKITVANFDSNGQQLHLDTFFESTKASKNTAYTYSDNGELVQYEFNGQYWKYYYNSKDSMLIKQEYYRDSLYEDLVAHYDYKYDNTGNYTVRLTYLNERDISPFLATIQQFDKTGKVLRREWVAAEEYSERTISYKYNNLGLCTESVFDKYGKDSSIRYEYEYY